MVAPGQKTETEFQTKGNINIAINNKRTNFQLDIP